jgi:GntR family transcriptional regulator/MocR family aminotransferase
LRFVRITLERSPSGFAPPVYQQIADQIRAEIEARSLCAGSRLPPIRDLARELGVNRDTVAQAYERLVTEGIVESSVGRGTFVASAGTARAVAPFQVAFSGLTERLLEFERARPRFGSGHDAVPMHTLVPDPGLYPADAFRKTLNRVLVDGGAELLLYGGPQGDPRLRAALAARLSGDALRVDPDEIVLCHGASQGIALALRLFTQTGDAVAVEEPTYNNALGAILGLGLRVVPIPMRDDGLALDALEQTLARSEVKALYTIPTFHNPMGTTTSLAHRRALLEIASRCGKPVIEDGYEMDLRFAGRPVPPLAGLDPSGRVVHLFSFSKSLFPGARVGAISARGRSVEALLALKQATDTATCCGCGAFCAPAARRCSGPWSGGCPRARAGRGPTGATRCGWSCPVRSTPASCWRMPWPPECSSRRAHSSIAPAAFPAACGSRSPWRTRKRCGTACGDWREW